MVSFVKSLRSYLVPKGKFGYEFLRELKASPVQYFNQQLLNYTQMFPSDLDNTFFALLVTQQLKLQSQINITMKKVCSSHLTAGILSHNFNETVNHSLRIIKHTNS